MSYFTYYKMYTVRYVPSYGMWNWVVEYCTWGLYIITSHMVFSNVTAVGKKLNIFTLDGKEYEYFVHLVISSNGIQIVHYYDEK